MSRLVGLAPSTGNKTRLDIEGRGFQTDAMIEASLTRWLQRPNIDRNTNSVVELTALLASDRGAVRGQNQDRALAFVIPTSEGRLSRARVFILADGMGGMRDGDLCASVTAAAFASALLAAPNQEPRYALQRAADHANSAVCAIARGAGGSTLSAVLIEANGRVHALNCGDSRIFAIGPDRSLDRITTDDSLAERVGGSNRELVRFVGMKEEFAVDIIEVAPDARQLILTSDGIHFVAAETLDSIARHAGNIRMLVERATTLARWCGGPDNATIIAVEIAEEGQAEPLATGGAIFYDAFSSISFQFAAQEQVLTEAATARSRAASTPDSEPPLPPVAGPLETREAALQQPSPRSLKSKRNKKQGRPNARHAADPVQYEISVGVPGPESDVDDDR